MPELTVWDGARRHQIHFEGTPLMADVLRQHGLYVATPCGGKGLCRKCALPAQGALEPAPAGGLALACATRLIGDATVRLAAREQLANIALAGALPPFTPNPQPGRWGLAVDIGTTTLAATLLDLSQARAVASAAARNPQRAIADNVIGRIQAALAGQGPALQSMVQEAIRALAQEVCRQAGIDQAQINCMALTGNTAMLYLYTARSPQALSAAPFLADWLGDEWQGSTYLAPCIGAFVGADTVCAILSSGMCSQPQTALLCDIGTNGEVALWHQGQLYCCATAAGPAFEGGGIACGAGSIPGAIDSVWAEGSVLQYTTIAYAEPRGLCGSGLIDAAAALLQTGQLDESGKLAQETVQIAPHVMLSAHDMRQLQLAKGAILAGINTLCTQVGVSARDIETFYVAGGFGAHLNMRSAAAIGRLPRALGLRAQSIGNAALAGAMMLLLRREFVQEARAIVGRAHIVTLSGNPAFNQAFVDAMMFEEM